jgi:hypothetical protein
MGYSDERLTQIYDKTSGKCHICCGKLAFRNYALFGGRGAWEVEHSIPKALGGTEHLNNLYAAHIYCNRNKRIYSTRSCRAQHGRSRAPLSASRRSERKSDSAVGGGLVGGVIGGVFGGPWGAAIGASIGAKLQYDLDPDW